MQTEDSRFCYDELEAIKTDNGYYRTPNHLEFDIRRYDMSMKLIGPAEEMYEETSLDIPAVVTYNGERYIVKEIADYAFHNRAHKVTKIRFPETLECIGTYSIKGFGALEELNLPPRLNRIGEMGLGVCPLIKEVTIPASVEKLCPSVFWGDLSLERINVEPDSEWLTSDDGIVYNKSKSLLMQYPWGKKDEKFIIPDTVRYIQAGALSHMSNVKEITLPKKLESISTPNFERCHDLVNIHVDSKNRHFAERDGVLFTSDFSYLVKYPVGREDCSYIVPDEVEVIGPYAFTDSEYLVNIIFPEKLKQIGEAAFLCCENLFLFDLPKKLRLIGESAFRACKALTKVEIPEKVKVIEENTFDNCEQLEHVIFSPKLEKIGKSAFNGCEKLQNVEFPETLQTIGEAAFLGCESFTEVVLPKSVRNIDEGAFSYCHHLSCVQIHQLTNYALNAFYEAADDAKTVWLD